MDKSELASAFQRSGVGVSNARLDRFFSYIDKDHDGLIDYNEWRGTFDHHLLRALLNTQNNMLTFPRLPAVHPNPGPEPPRCPFLLPVRRTDHAGGRCTH